MEWRQSYEGSFMTELRQALDDISAIRTQVARGTQFRGYGPLSVASSGVLALLVAGGESRWMAGSNYGLKVIFERLDSNSRGVGVPVGARTIFRARRVHSGLAMEMIQAAVEQFSSQYRRGNFADGGADAHCAARLGMLPGLWEVMFSLGVFASCRFLPRQMFGVGAWYLAAGLVCLLVASGHHALSPWEMGIPSASVSYSSPPCYAMDSRMPLKKVTAKRKPIRHLPMTGLVASSMSAPA